MWERWESFFLTRKFFRRFFFQSQRARKLDNSVNNNIQCYFMWCNIWLLCLYDEVVFFVCEVKCMVKLVGQREGNRGRLRFVWVLDGNGDIQGNFSVTVGIFGLF